MTKIENFRKLNQNNEILHIGNEKDNSFKGLFK